MSGKTYQEKKQNATYSKEEQGHNQTEKRYPKKLKLIKRKMRKTYKRKTYRMTKGILVGGAYSGFGRDSVEISG